MKKNNYFLDYLALFSVFCLSLLFFAYFGFDPLIQQIIILAVAVFYILWGIIHHKLAGDYHPKVLGEYAAVAFFGAALVLVLLNRI